MNQINLPPPAPFEEAVAWSRTYQPLKVDNTLYYLLTGGVLAGLVMAGGASYFTPEIPEPSETTVKKNRPDPKVKMSQKNRADEKKKEIINQQQMQQQQSQQQFQQSQQQQIHQPPQQMQQIHPMQQVPVYQQNQNHQLQTQHYPPYQASPPYAQQVQQSPPSPPYQASPPQMSQVQPQQIPQITQPYYPAQGQTTYNSPIQSMVQHNNRVTPIANGTEYVTGSDGVTYEIIA